VFNLAGDIPVDVTEPVHQDGKKNQSNDAHRCSNGGDHCITTVEITASPPLSWPRTLGALNWKLLGIVYTHDTQPLKAARVNSNFRRESCESVKQSPWKTQSSFGPGLRAKSNGEALRAVGLFLESSMQFLTVNRCEGVPVHRARYYRRPLIQNPLALPLWGDDSIVALCVEVPDRAGSVLRLRSRDQFHNLSPDLLPSC